MLNNIVIQAHEGIEVSNILFRDVALDITNDAKLLESYGYTEWDNATSKGVFYVANARDVTLEHVRVRISAGNAPYEYSLLGHNAEDVALHDVRVKKHDRELQPLLTAAAMAESKVESKRDYMKGDTFMAYPVSDDDLSVL